MGLEDDIAFFEQVPTFAALGKQALRILAIGAETRTLQKGAVLFYAGELAEGGYVVQEGSLVLEPNSSQLGKKVTVGPGTLVGELALLTDTVCGSTAIAKEPTVVIRISRSLFRKMLEGYPAAAQKMRDMVAERVDGWSRELGGVKAALTKSE
ncbi:MAG TPA: Crp/Fnr family transcriptional regulator [Pseudolabrys sp.]|nr:Crp/Fnr family transcriptional regulator [Pseudolabrys sp.]